jgi:hypothetical protein
LKNSTLSEVQVPSPRGGDTAFSIVKEKPEEKNEVTKTLSHIKKFIAIQSPTEALRLTITLILLLLCSVFIRAFLFHVKFESVYLLQHELK